jgi:hypothetical protein
LAFSLLRLPLALARRIASTFQYDLQVTFPATLFALPMAQNCHRDGLASRHVDDEGSIQFKKCGVVFS